MNKNTKISDLTVGELMEIVRAVVRDESEHTPTTAFGLQGLADAFGVSVSQAKRMRATGELDRAITQRGRTIVVDIPLARQLWAKGTKNKSS